MDSTSTTGNLAALNATGGVITINGQNITIAANDGEANALTALQAGQVAGGYTVVDNGNDTFTLTSAAGTDLVVGGDSTTLTELGLASGNASTSGDITINGQTVSLAAGDDAAAILGKIQAAATASSGGSAFTVSNASGVLTITGTAGNDVTFGGDTEALAALGLTAGTTNGTPAADNNAGDITINGQTITLAGGDDAAAILAKFQAAATASSGSNAFTVSNASGVLTITGTAGNDLVVGGDASTLSAVGLTSGTTNGTPAVDNNAGDITINGQTITLAGGDDAAAILAKFQAAATASSGSNAFTVSNASGVLTITGTAGNDVVIGGDASTLSAVGLSSGTTNGTPAVDNDAGNITINGQTIALAGGDTAATILSKFQAAASATTGTNAFTVSNASGVLTFTGTAGNDLVIGGDAATLTALGLTSGTVDGTPASSGTTIQVANPKRAELVTQYNDLLDQIDQLTKDSGFNGVNLLNGDSLSVLFNEDGTSSLDIAGADTTATTGLGLAALTSTDFDSNTSINSTLNDLKAAIDTLRSQSSKFGSNLSVVQTRQDFTKAIINTLQTGASNLTLADFERRSGEPSRPADPSEPFDQGAVAGLAVRPERPASAAVVRQE